MELFFSKTGLFGQWTVSRGKKSKKRRKIKKAFLFITKKIYILFLLSLSLVGFSALSLR